ncbi:hypothetical protein FRC02_012263 [Tulasnella sp. 418]|nr:hypothetical protein FRC02_012263 [Tulasnella sp. 418]
MAPLTVKSPKSLTQLRDSEKAWAKRYQFLEENGYRLRPRYRPDWTPSWVHDGVEDANVRWKAEDAISMWRPAILDAERIKDGKIVILKQAKANTPEIEIGRYVSSPELRDEESNHCMPLLDVLTNPEEPEQVILVIPLLRHIEIPMPVTVSECVDFVQQTLEVWFHLFIIVTADPAMIQGLNFMHSKGIAHRDCAIPNIMMDARRMFPDSWHAMDPSRLPNGEVKSFKNVTRTGGGGVRYYFIDFGLSSKGEELVTGTDGQERAPEQSQPDKPDQPSKPYSPFKLDIYMLGMTFKRHILLKTRGAEFFVRPLVEVMTVVNPDLRPSAEDCMKHLERLLAKPNSSRILNRRVRPYNPERENVVQTLVRDANNYLSNWRAKPIEGPKDIPDLDPLYL